VRGAHAPVRGDPLMKPLLVDRSWGAKGGVEAWVERPIEVSRFDLEKIRSKNFQDTEGT
jgi:hypothetical protein